MTTNWRRIPPRPATLALAVAVVLGGCSGGASPAPESPPDVIVQRPEREEIIGLIGKADFAAAESRAREVLEEVEATEGPDTVAAAEVMDLWVETLWRSGRAADARAPAERAVAIKERRLDEDSLALAVSLSNLAIVQAFVGEHDASRALHERVLAIREHMLGADHPKVAHTLIALGNLFLEAGEYERAIGVYDRALGIQDRALGADDPEIGLTLNNLAETYKRLGKYAVAERHAQRALEIKEAALGPDHIDVAWTVDALAGIREEAGDYASARSLYERGLEIRENHLGPDHLHVVYSLNNLANVLRQTGYYTEARSHYERGLEIAEESLGPEHLTVATFKNNLAELLRLTGDYATAMELHAGALAIRESLLGPDSTQVATSSGRIAALLTERGELDAAARHYERSLAIWKGSVGTDHQDYAEYLDGLADVRVLQHDYDAAARLYREALAVNERILDPVHPAVASNLYGLATVLAASGQRDEARDAYRRALGIRERSLGASHPLVGEVCAGLARVVAADGGAGEALDLALRAEEIGRDHLRLTVRALPERQALLYAFVRASGLDLALSLAAAETLDADQRRRVTDALFRSRALVLDEMASRHREARLSNDPETERLVAELAMAGTRLANLAVRGPDALHPERYLATVDAARQQKERIEQRLGKSSAALRRDPSAVQLGIDEIVGRIPAGAALVSYSLYRHRDLEGTAAGPVPHYIASVVRPGAELRLLTLGPARDIDDSVLRWSAAVADPEAAVGDYRIAGAALREKIWDPLVPALKGVARVFIVPDGELSLVSFASLPTSATRYFIETGPRVHYLTSERDLVPVDDAPRFDNLLALGGADFDDARLFASLSGNRRDTASRATGDGVNVFRGERPDCGDFRALRFERLPASEREIDDIASIWLRAGRSGEALTLVGHDARESAFKAEAPSHRIVHVATHGFFLAGGCTQQSAGSRGIGGLRPESSGSSEAMPGNPLLLSGLVLAGANHRDAASPGEEDGVLTAEEIAAMDLRDVEWAVLSACDTGVGEIKAGEGVFGLRRAFVVAGARTVVMSLWAVDDESARDWMRRLYEARWVEGLTTADAAHEAGLQLLGARREMGESDHPASWAGFVAAGDWR